MKNQFLVLPFLLFTYFLSAQISYEPGYFIDNSGTRTNCLIRNVDWKNNPTSFNYKSSEQSEPQKAHIAQVQEFGFPGLTKFERHTVAMDRSSDMPNSLDDNRKINLKEEQLFLSVLIEGDANLYYFEDRNLRRFFFSQGGSDIKQLVYKRFRKSEIEIGENNQFRQQLLNGLRCNDISKNYVNRVSYRKDALLGFFKKYNACMNVDITVYKEDKGKFEIHVSPKIGIRNSSLSIRNDFTPFRDVDFDSKIGLTFGVDFEISLPFNKGKWNLFIEPSLQSYKTEKSTNKAGFSNTTIAHVNYKSIEIPFGFRHYFFFNENSKLFIHGALVYDKTLDSSTISYENSPTENEINTDESLSVGIGYKFKDRLIIEVRSMSKRSVLIDHASLTTDFGDNFSIIFGYTLF